MPNNVDTNRYSLTIKDYSNEDSTTTVNTKSLTDNVAYEAARDAFNTAVDNITSGRLAAYTESNIVRLSNQPAIDSSSARELKVLVSYEDTVTFKKFSVTVPTFRPSLVTMMAGTDLVDITAGSAAAFVTAFEAFVNSPDGNAVSVISMRLVGRNI